MEGLPLQYLVVPPNAVEIVRKEFGVEKPGRINEAIEILSEWASKQEHFKSKKFRKYYLETTILSSKGSIERAKVTLDKLCTLRTLLPHFFGFMDVKTCFGNLFDVGKGVILPNLTPELYRVFILRIDTNDYDAKQSMDLYRYGILTAEHCKMHDYMRGYVVVVDFTKVHLIEVLKKMSPVELKQFMTILIEGYGMRLKGLHVITTSTLINTFVNIMKQILKPKLAARIHVHKNMDFFTDLLPIEHIPADYGGKERSLAKLQDEMLDMLTTKEFLEFLKEVQECATDEKYRQIDKFNEQYAGMAGTFRMLTVD